MAASLSVLSVVGRLGAAVSMLAFFTAVAATSVLADMMVFEYVPAALIGRTSGVLSILEATPGLAAPLLVTALSSALGVRPTFVVLAAVALTAVVTLRHFGRRNPAAWAGPP